MAYRLLGITDERTSCDLCGKTNLKCTMALEELDADGNGEAVVYFGRDCGSRALGWKATASRAEKLIDGTAKFYGNRGYDLWKAAYTHGCGFYTGPATVEIDGVTIEVLNAGYPTAAWSGKDLTAGGWHRVAKTGKLYWRLPRK